MFEITLAYCMHSWLFGWLRLDYVFGAGQGPTGNLFFKYKKSDFYAFAVVNHSGHLEQHALCDAILAI